MRSPWLLALALPLTGCFAEGYSMRDRVMEAARKYNEGVIWNHVEQSVPYLAKEEQHAFVERMAALEEELEFADGEMVQLDVDKKRERATARMSYAWTLKRRGLMEKTTTEQTWVEKNGKWTLLVEVRLRGSPLPIWKERSEVAEQLAEIKNEPEPEAQGAMAGGPGPAWKK